MRKYPSIKRAGIGGFTPAYAGKRNNLQSMLGDRKDHPRIRGEKKAALTVKPTAGITPAYAGKRPSSNWPSLSARDHPRIRGEKSSSNRPETISEGSPPHTRGKAILVGSVHHRHGITPAYAGNQKRSL